MSQKHRLDHKKFRVLSEGESLKLSKISTLAGKELGKQGAQQAMAADLEMLQAAQDRLFAEGRKILAGDFARGGRFGQRWNGPSCNEWCQPSGVSNS